VLLAANIFPADVKAQNDTEDRSPVVIQPGAPGEPSRVLPPSTRGTITPVSRKDVEFMQGMILHHAQAVEMTDLIGSRTDNEAIRLLGARISRSQQDEIEFMKRWLRLRGESFSGTHGGHRHGSLRQQGGGLMPGMLSREQMSALRSAKGAEFDRLFLEGMIQHHIGAIEMVRDLFDTSGAGQDAEIFNFATDVDNSQRAEIKTMQTLLSQAP
jgi:uncharacterized protein (DUF305 family)